MPPTHTIYNFLYKISGESNIFVLTKKLSPFEELGLVSPGCFLINSNIGYVKS